MSTILHLDASARNLDIPFAEHNSLSKMLASKFSQQWQERRPEDKIIHRDLGKTPPPFISQEWVGAAFTPEKIRTDEQNSLLAVSDTFIDELDQADIILISSPMYNYGMPAALKAWFDQVIRVNKTISFDLSRGDYPIEPIMSGKTLVLISSSGEFGFEAGGVRESMNHLGPHIKVLGRYLGVDDFHEIRVEYQEFGDHRHKQSVNDAHSSVTKLVEQLHNPQIQGRRQPKSHC